MQPYKCDKCDIIFSKKNGLQKHLKIHTADKKCNSIKSTVLTNNNLISRTFYTCLECNSSFSQKSSLKRHLMIHTGENPFSCLTCNKKFKNKYNLEVHTWGHIRQEEQDMHVKQTQSEYTQSEYTDKIQNLNIFINMNINERPFECIVCDKLFKFKSNLTQHMKTHIERCTNLIPPFYIPL